MNDAETEKLWKERRERQAALESTTHKEDLGTKTMHGVAVHGSRTVRMYPAGAVGNTKPIEVVTEEWRADSLGLDMLRTVDDPRSGKTTMEVEELTLGEPDSALFTPPTGYVVHEIQQQQ